METDNYFDFLHSRLNLSSNTDPKLGDVLMPVAWAGPDICKVLSRYPPVILLGASAAWAAGVSSAKHQQNLKTFEKSVHPS